MLPARGTVKFDDDSESMVGGVEFAAAEGRCSGFVGVVRTRGMPGLLSEPEVLVDTGDALRNPARSRVLPFFCKKMRKKKPAIFKKNCTHMRRAYRLKTVVYSSWYGATHMRDMVG